MSRKKEIKNIRPEINEIESKKSYKTSESKSRLSDKINKIGKLLTRLIKKKNREDLNKQNWKLKKRSYNCHNKIQRIVRKYYK